MLRKRKFTTVAEIESIMTMAGGALVLIAHSGFWQQTKKFFKFDVSLFDEMEMFNMCDSRRRSSVHWRSSRCIFLPGSLRDCRSRRSSPRSTLSASYSKLYVFVINKVL